MLKILRPALTIVGTVLLTGLGNTALATGSYSVPTSLPGTTKRVKPRLLYRTRTAAMGVRGLHEGTLKDALPDLQELSLLSRWSQRLATEARDSSVLAPDARPSAFPLPASDEIAAGEKLSAALLGAAPLVRDEETHAYLRSVGLRLAAQSGRPDLPWRFGILASDSLNAFAAPGGTVLITLGLYRMLRNEAELAGVLAHEIAHIAQGHSVQLFLKQRALEEAVKGTGRVPLPPPVRAALKRQLKPGALFFSAALERESELEADRLAALFARDAGYPAQAFVSVLKRLSEHPDSVRGELNLLLKTHPSPKDRLAAYEPLLTGRLAETPRVQTDQFERYRLVNAPLMILDRDTKPLPLPSDERSKAP